MRRLPETKDELVSRFDLDLIREDDAFKNQLLDCHGIGRVVFRNAGSAVSGFPKRNATVHILAYAEWQTRYEWLAQFLKQNPEEKFLVLTHDKDQVNECESYPWQKYDLDAAVFNEDVNLIERPLTFRV